MGWIKWKLARTFSLKIFSWKIVRRVKAEEHKRADSPFPRSLLVPERYRKADLKRVISTIEIHACNLKSPLHLSCIFVEHMPTFQPIDVCPLFPSFNFCGSLCELIDLCYSQKRNSLHGIRPLFLICGSLWIKPSTLYYKMHYVE